MWKTSICLFDWPHLCFLITQTTIKTKYQEQFKQCNIEIQAICTNLVNGKGITFHHESARPTINKCCKILKILNLKFSRIHHITLILSLQIFIHFVLYKMIRMEKNVTLWENVQNYLMSFFEKKLHSSIKKEFNNMKNIGKNYRKC